MQRAHLDLWGPYDLISIGNNRYFVVIIDDNIRKMWTYSVMSKEMFFSVFKMWKKDIKTEIRLKFSNLLIDSRGKYISLALKKFCKEEGIVIEFTSPYIFDQNSIAKRSGCILDTIKDAILIDSKLLRDLWTETITITAYLKNLLPTNLIKKVSEVFLILKRQDVGHLVVF